MEIIAHRGCNQLALENSWSAFHMAVEHGCDRIEMDLQMTSDNEIIILHDDSLRRTAGVTAKISNLTLKEIRSLRLKNDEAIPELTQVIEEFAPKIQLNLELKGKHIGVAHRLNTVLKENKFLDQIIVSCFHSAPLKYLKTFDIGIKRAVLWGRDTITAHPYYYINPLRFLSDCDSKIFHPMAKMLSRPLMNRMRMSGIKVYPWVSMDGEDGSKKYQLWQRMEQLGIDGLCTNTPEKFRPWLERRGFSL